ncbi:MAG: type II toxin-antitoxin system VapC family toxin [Methylohalobius sp.]|nr:type II toxin-antitoxin system VapC family toxin [Methylohalobius sp.]
MAVKVVDASAVGVILFGEPESAAVAGRLAGTRLVAPWLLPFEVASICCKKLRLHPEQRERLLAAFDLYPNLGIELIEVKQREIVRLAEKTGLTNYDASYLWLAEALNAELVTLDRRLAAAR